MKILFSILSIIGISMVLQQTQAAQQIILHAPPKMPQQTKVLNEGNILLPPTSRNEFEIRILTAKTPENMKKKEYADKYLIELVKVDTTLTRLLPNSRKLELSFIMDPKEKDKDYGLFLEEFITLRDVLLHFKENLFLVLTGESQLTIENKKLEEELSQVFNEQEEEEEEVLNVYRELLCTPSRGNRENSFVELVKAVVKSDELQTPLKTKIRRSVKRKAEDFIDMRNRKRQKLMIASWATNDETVDYSLTYKNPLNLGSTTIKFVISKLEENPGNLSYLICQLDELIMGNFFNLILRNIYNVISEINSSTPKQAQSGHQMYS